MTEGIYTKSEAQERLAELQSIVNEHLDTSEMTEEEKAAFEKLPYEERVPAGIIRQMRRMQKLIADFKNQG